MTNWSMGNEKSNYETTSKSQYNYHQSPETLDLMRENIDLNKKKKSQIYLGGDKPIFESETQAQFFRHSDENYQ